MKWFDRFRRSVHTRRLDRQGGHRYLFSPAASIAAIIYEIP